MSQTNYPFTKPRPNIIEILSDKFQHFPTYAKKYFLSLFPIINWIGRYNLTWLTSDLIAGLTIGAVVIPQGMGYAKIAELPVEYGLYTSFVGVSLYSLFATSKDITIGPTAVMSLLLGQTIIEIQKKLKTDGFIYSNPDIAGLITFVIGIITVGLGLARLGILVDFIPGPVINSFSTGSAISIALGQVAKLMGIKNIDNKEASYLVLGKTLRAFDRTKIDAVMGIFSLLLLYLIKYATQYAGKRYPKLNRVWFFTSILRNIFVIFLATLISFLVVHKHKSSPPISVLKDVPSGLHHIRVPKFEKDLFHGITQYIPIFVIILILEHVAIAKNFGRVNNYKIVPSQEMIAIGTTNVIGSFLGAYPATGSFSRTALKSKSGVRTPLAGIFSGILVILGLYVLTPAFYYIPDSALAAVIIHAVLDLISSPRYVLNLWKIQFWDFAVFVVGVVVIFFSTIEIGIYASTGLALVVILVRIARPRFESLGLLPLEKSKSDQPPRYAFVALHHPSFPDAKNPPEGVLIFRFDESLTYPNSSYLEDKVVTYAKKRTRSYFKRAEKKGDRPWNDAGAKRTEDETANATLPRLKAVVFDFSAVSIIDTTGVQTLLDIRTSLNKHSAQLVEYHFANLLDQNIQGALIAGGFNLIDSDVNLAGHPVPQLSMSTPAKSSKFDVEANGNIDEKLGAVEDRQKGPTKFFHLTLEEAVNAASNVP
ncbi:hypothetical protein G9A89_001159 [Geosiphon pyriformis]|nr:hypothetical protein G9A89_001159 [Geosiphon pyriformis]